MATEATIPGSVLVTISAGIEQPEGSKNIDEQTDSEKDCMVEPQLILATEQKPKVVGPDLVAGENLEATGINEHIETEQVHVEEVPHQVQEISSTDGSPKETVVVEMPDRNQDGIEELDNSNAASDFKKHDIDIYESGKGSKQNETDIEYREGERDENHEIISEHRYQVVEEVSEETPLAGNITQILQEPSYTKLSKEQDPVITFEKIEDEIRRTDGNPATDNLDGTNATRTIEETCSLEGELRDPEISASEHETLVNEQDGEDEARQQASTALPETTAQDPQESPEEKLDEENEIMDKDISSEQNIEKKTDIKEVVKETPLDFLDAAHVEVITVGIEQSEGSKNIDEQTDSEKDCMVEPQLILATDQKPKVVGPDLVVGENLEATGISEHIETEQVHVEEVPHQVQEIPSTDGSPKETVVVEMPDRNQDGIEELDNSNAASDFKEQDIDIYESRKGSKQNETDIEYREGERDENHEIISEHRYQVVEEVSEETLLAENITQILQEPSSTKLSKEQVPVITFEKSEDEIRWTDGNPVTDNLDGTNATRTIEETCSLDGELRNTEISTSEHETLVNEQDGQDEARQEASTALPETTAQCPQESLVEKLAEENEIMDKDISSEQELGSELVAEENLETTSISIHTDTVEVQAEEIPHQVQEISSNARTPHEETMEGTMPPINITSSTCEPTEGSIIEEEVIYRAKIGTAAAKMTVDTSSKEVEEDIYIAKIQIAVAKIMNLQLDECAIDFTKVPEDKLIPEATNTTLQHEAVNIFKLEDSSSIIQPMAAEDAGADKDSVMAEMPNRNRENIEELETSNELSDINEQENDICERGKTSTLNGKDIENQVEERTEASEIISEFQNHVVEELTKEAPLAENLSQILQEPSSAMLCEEKERITTATTEKIEDEGKKKDESPVTEDLEGTNATRTTGETCSLEGEARELGVSPSEHEIFENKQDSLDEEPHEASTSLPETPTPEHLKEKLDEENETMDNGTSSEQNKDQKTDIMEDAKESPIEFLDAAHIEEDVGRTSECEKIEGEGGATDIPNQDITADGRTNVSCGQEEIHTTGRKTNTEATALTEEVIDTDLTHIENLGVKYQNADSETEDPHAAEDPNEESRVSLIIRSTERELKEGTENLLNISSPEQQVSHNIREENIESTDIYHSQESVPLLAEASVEKVQVDEKPCGQHEEEFERVNLKETDSIVLQVVTTGLAVAEEERMKAKKLDTEEAQTGEIESSAPATKDIEQVSKSIAANSTGKEEVSEVPKPIPELLNTVEPVIEGNKFPHESLPYGTIKDQHEESSATKLLEEQKCENTTTNETIEDQSIRNEETLVNESSESSIARGTAEDVSLKNETFKEVESSKLELEINDQPDGATKEEKISALEETTAIVKENNEYIETHEELMPAYESVTDDQTKEIQDSQEVMKDILMAEEVCQGITFTAQSVVVVPDAEERANVKLYVNEESTHIKELTPVSVENVGEIIKSDLGPTENLEVRESIEATEREKLQAKDDLIGDSEVSEEDKRQHIENNIIMGADDLTKTVKEQSINANKESETLQASDAYKTRDGKLEARDSIEDTGAENLQAKEDLKWESRASTVTGVSEEDAKQRVEKGTIMTTELEESEQIIRDESIENCDANKACEVLPEPDETSKAFGIESKPIEQETPINAVITKELPEETEWADLTKNILEAMMAGETPVKEFSTNEILQQPTEETKNILEETTNTDTEQQSYGSRGTSREYMAPTEELSGREDPAKEIQVETMAKSTPLEEPVTYSIGDGVATKILQEETKVGNNIEEAAIRLDLEGKSDEIDCVNTNSEDINLIKEVPEEVERASPTKDIRGNTMIEATGELSQLPVLDGIANEILPQEPNEIKNVEETIKLDLKENSEEGIFSYISKEATTCIEEFSKEVEVQEETMVEHTPIQELSHHQITNKTANEISSHEIEEIKNDEEAPTILDLKETSDETNCTNMNKATTLVEKLPRDIEKTAPAEDIQEETMDNLVEELLQHAIAGGTASDVLPQQTKEINNVEEVPIKDRDMTTQAITLVEELLEEAEKDGPIEDIQEETATKTPLEKPSQYSIGDGIAMQILPQETKEVKNVNKEPTKLDLEEKRDKANCEDESMEASTLIEELSEDVERAGMGEDIKEEATFEGTHAKEPCHNPQDTTGGENVGKGIQKLEDSLSVMNKQNQHEAGSNENAEAELSSSSIHVVPEQAEPVEKSFNTEEEDSTTIDAIGSEPQCEAEDFKEEKETSKGNENRQDSAKSSLAFLIRGSTSGISEELAKLIEENEQKEKQEDQQLDKARVHTNKEEENSEEKEEEQDQEEGDDNQKEETGYDAPVMVEASKDMDAKVHKKPHNILSGVGTKVKHSISKVKKAITGKSSHPKSSSP